MLYLIKGPVKITHHDQNGEINAYYLKEASGSLFQKLEEAVKCEMEEMGPRGLAEYLKYGQEERKLLDDIVESIIVDIDTEGSVATVKTKRDLTEREIEVLEDDLSGQYSDGWGEGFEQREIDSYEETYNCEEYDEEEGEIVTEEYEETINVYAHFWQHDNFKLKTTKSR